jgi:hypothetical protein
MGLLRASGRQGIGAFINCGSYWVRGLGNQGISMQEHCASDVTKTTPACLPACLPACQVAAHHMPVTRGIAAVCYWQPGALLAAAAGVLKGLLSCAKTSNITHVDVVALPNCNGWCRCWGCL